MEEDKFEVVETGEVVRSEDSQGHKVINNYTIIKKLGEGSFGKVKLCQKGDKLFAMKIYNKFLLKKKRDYVRSADVIPSSGLDRHQERFARRHSRNRNHEKASTQERCTTSRGD